MQFPPLIQFHALETGSGQYIDGITLAMLVSQCTFISGSVTERVSGNNNNKNNPHFKTAPLQLTLFVVVWWCSVGHHLQTAFFPGGCLQQYSPANLEAAKKLSHSNPA